MVVLLFVIAGYLLSCGWKASGFPTTSLLVSPTTSEHTTKKMKAACELGLTHMDCSTEQPGSIPGPECASCKRVFSPYFKKEPVYQLPCGHLLCRPCLGEKQRSLPVACTACQRPFASQDVLRVHF
ncbi:RING finger protein 37 [Vulpes lagopus]